VRTVADLTLRHRLVAPPLYMEHQTRKAPPVACAQCLQGTWWGLRPTVRNVTNALRSRKASIHATIVLLIRDNPGIRQRFISDALKSGAADAELIKPIQVHLGNCVSRTPDSRRLTCRSSSYLQPTVYRKPSPQMWSIRLSLLDLRVPQTTWLGSLPIRAWLLSNCTGNQDQ